MSHLARSSSSLVPKLIHQYTSSQGSGRSIEVWTTSCIVQNFGGASQCTALINPANPQLSGVSKFSYFPRGGPVPKQVVSMHKDWQPLGYVSSWGGMEVGSGMMYPVQVVDGVVHQLGGWKLQAELKWKRLTHSQSRESSIHANEKDDTSDDTSEDDNVILCPIGSAVQTTHACQALSQHYQAIFHTAPPFFLHHEQPEQGLKSCYASALALAQKNHVRIASPLLGAGARGFPLDTALAIAAQASVEWVNEETTRRQPPQTLAFGLLQEAEAAKLANCLEQELARVESLALIHHGE